MNTVLQLLFQTVIDHSVAFDAVLSGESVAGDHNSEMAFTVRMMPPMSDVACRFILYFQYVGLETGGQFVFDPVADGVG